MLGAALAAAIALNPAVTSATLQATVCRAGWAQAQRPSARYVADLEAAMLPAGADRAAWVMDHVMPISLGGAPVDPGNLRPQLVAQAKAKDRDETRLHAAVCAGRMTLPAAQAEMRRLWP